MTTTFQIVRDPTDADQWRFITDNNAVWGSLFCDFFHNGAMPELQERIATNAVQEIECVIMTKAHYDVLMDAAAVLDEEAR
jgi:hypothetical protein